MHTSSPKIGQMVFLTVWMGFFCHPVFARLWEPQLDAIPELIALYDASDSSTVITNTSATSNVLTWQDKSTNVHHLTSVGGNRPTYNTPAINGLNVIWLDSTFDEMTTNAIPDIDVTNVFIISVGMSLSPGDYPNLGSIQKTDSSDKIALRTQANDGGMSGRMNFSFRVDSSSYSLTSSYNTNLYDNIPFMIASWYDGSTANARTDGGVVSTSANPPDALTFTINEIQIGRESNTPRNQHGEMIVMKDADLTLREKTEGYLAWKWGLEDKLPLSHPYKNAAPMVADDAFLFIVR